MELKDAIFTAHALDQMRERRITLEQAQLVLAQPEEVLPVRTGRVVAQGMIGEHLLRVFVDVDRDPPEVVTVYRTSQIDKYRSQP
jgi:hypothetical protein